MIDPPDVVPEALQDLVAAEKSRPDPAPEVGERVFARLSVSLGLPPPAGDAGPSAGEPRGAPDPGGARLLRRTLVGTPARRLVTVVVGAAIGAGTLGTVHYLRRGSAPTAPVEVHAPPSPEPAATAPVAAAETPPSEAVAGAPPAGAQSRAGESRPAPSDLRDVGLAAERKLIEAARAMLTSGQTERALATLRRHARSFPQGRLAEERESLFVRALVAKGQFTQARQRAGIFERKYPHSLFQPVVEESLRSIP